MSLRNRLVLPIVLSSLAVLGGCGSSTNKVVPPPSGAFSNTDFNGTYTFSVLGQDIGSGNGSVSAMAGSLKACGCTQGTISGGNVDVVDNTGGVAGAAIGANSTYKITKDGRGFSRLLITPTGGTQFEVDVDFVLTSSSHGLITQFDGNGTGSGTIDLQNTASQTTLANIGFAYSLTGTDLATTPDPLSQVGAFTLDGSGNILASGASAGVADTTFYNANTLSAVPNANSPLTGTVLVGSGTAPGTATLTTSFGTLTFDVYEVDSTHLKLIENDGFEVLVGDVFSQPSATIPQGNYVFTVAGPNPGGNPFVAGGLMTSDGVGTISNGAEDLNDNGVVDFGNVPAVPQSFSGTFTTMGSVGGGRFAVTLSTFVGGATFAAYPSSGGLLLQEIDAGTAGTAGITSGVALAQTSGAGIASSQGYGMNLTGFDLGVGAELDAVAQFTTTSSGMTGLLDENDGAFTGLGSIGTSNLSGSYTAGSNGTGSASFNAGVQSVFYYAADNSTVLFISTDANQDQVSLGSFEVQTAPAQGAIERPQARPLPMLRTMSHPHLGAAARSNARFVRK